VARTQGLRIGAGALRAVLVSAAALVGALLALVVLSGSPALAAAESPVSPLPASDYAVRHVCPAPAPGYAGCLALELVPRTAAARAHIHPLGITTSRPIVAAKASEGAYGLTPQALHSAYQLPYTTTATQTIALIDAYDDPHAEQDLAFYDKEFGLPPCTAADGCFRKINQNGDSTPLPSSNGEEAEGWAVEISTDIEAAHAICQSCHITLVEANSPSFEDLEEAEATAARPLADTGAGATEISNSFGGSENGITTAEDNASAFNQPGIVVTASAGDDGYLDWDAENEGERGHPDYPASSPHVIAVGGTHLDVSGSGWEGESVWNGYGATGGGCSMVLSAPPWQQSAADWSAVGCGTGSAAKRAVNDVSADGDPYTGMAVYDSAECEYEGGVDSPWCTIGGTSLASPIIAATFALAGGAHGVQYPAQTLYENETISPGSLHDVESGSNGECLKEFDPSNGLSGCTSEEEASNSHCSGELICLAAKGYDGPSGVGTPNGIVAFQPPSEAAKKLAEAKRKAEEKSAEEKKAEEKKAEEKKAEEKKAEEKKAEEKLTAEKLLEEERQQKEKKAEEEKDQSGGFVGGGTGANSPSTADLTTGVSARTPSTAAGAPIIKLTALALTPTALLALDRPRSKISSIAFAFTLSVAARVRATLAKLVRVHGHNCWVSLPGALAFSAVKGRNQRHLASPETLTSGRYRLTLAPQGGIAQTLTLQVG
jgi:hypothetical protein